MPIQSSGVTGRSVQATDGGIGSVADMLFDDTAWAVRWVVVDTGEWLPGRRVLIPPAAVAVTGGGAVSVDMTSDQVRKSPGNAADSPVSRQLEQELHAHYGWAPYWAGDPASLGGIVAPLAPVGP